MPSKQRLVFAASLAFGASLASPLAAAAPDSPRSPTDSAVGFYGGLVLREGTRDSGGVRIGQLDSPWGKFAAPIADDAASRTLFFGGYRWRNDVAVEAAFLAAETGFSLTPAGRRGVGLSLAQPAESAAARSWNADLYTSWSLRRSLALYGRLGYAQADPATSFYTPASPGGDVRRARDGVNYGVGLRYDVTSELGLRLEYARFGRFAGESVGGLLPDSDQVQFGVQLRF
jgi:opacity protein-like surface antigen